MKASLFKELRYEWYRMVLYERAPQGRFEEKCDEEARLIRNVEIERMFNRHTERLIKGDTFYPVAPLSTTEVLTAECQDYKREDRETD